MKKMIRPILLLVMLSGCSNINTQIKDPEMMIPDSWSTTTADPIKGQENWWKNFNDPQLNALVERALRTNNDFSVAVIRVRRAQLQAGLVDTNLTPSVSAGLSARATRTLDVPSTYYSSGLTSAMNYELDLWGKLSNQRASARWETQATESDCRAYALSLLGTTTRLYWQLAYLNQLLALSKADIEYAEKILALARIRYKAGATSGLTIAELELNLSSQQANQTQLVQQRVEARNALAILFNQPPQSEIVYPSALSDEPLPVVSAGIPAAILANRPDLSAAELRLRSSLANVAITRKSFYPKLSLTGDLGTASTTLFSLLQNPVLTLGAGLTLPFIQWNTTQLSIRVSKTQYEEAVINYRQSLYTAFAEVEDRLSARTQLIAEEAKLKLARAQAKRAENISRIRFKAGYTDVQPWLITQANLRNTERSIISNRLNQLNNQVNLYKALGIGGESGRIKCQQP